MYRAIKQDTRSANPTFSFIVPADGSPRGVWRVLSSMPRADVIVLEIEGQHPGHPLRPLPLTPFPVYAGTPILTHLFATREPPRIQHSVARTRETRALADSEQIEKPIRWPSSQSYRRYGVGTMLGYRSYTGLELEVSTGVVTG